MLKLFFHKRATRTVFLCLIVVVLSAVMLLDRANSPGQVSNLPQYVGTIYEKPVTFNEFYGAVANVKAQMTLENFDKPEILEKLLKNRPLLSRLAWQRLIMLREVRSRGIKVSDKEVVDLIKVSPLFSRKGEFDNSAYRSVLKNYVLLEPRRFEELLREDVGIQKFRNIFTADMKLSDEEVIDEYKKDFQKFRISYALIEFKDFTNKVKIDESLARGYYEDHKMDIAAYRTAKEGAAENRAVSFDDVKGDIIAYLSEIEGRAAAIKYAEDMYKKLAELTDKDKNTFEAACTELGLKNQMSDFFSKSDNIEGIGPAAPLIDIVRQLKEGHMSNLIELKDNILLFRVAETEKTDEAKFKAEKEAYSKKVIERKKNKFLDMRLRNLELRTSLNIDLDDLEKYNKGREREKI